MIGIVQIHGGNAYLACDDLKMTEKALIAEFVLRFQRKPKEVTRDHCAVWAGPLTIKEFERYIIPGKEVS